MAFPVRRVQSGMLAVAAWWNRRHTSKHGATLVSTVAFQSMVPTDLDQRPVGVAVHFLFPRPKSHYRTGKNAHLLRAGAPDRPTTRSVGDTDKLCRAILDSLAVTSGGALLR